jgi:hypothetical protein
MTRSKGRTGRPYRTARAQLAAKRLPCWICGQPINYQLPSTDPQGFVADHDPPLAYGGHPLRDIKAAHRLCNGKRGTKAASAVVILPRSRNW